MQQTLFRTLMFAAGIVAALVVTGTFDLGTTAQVRAEVIRRRSDPDLFYNYYAPPVGGQGVGAELYLCPRPTPPLVGHTYVTYQPLMPHEFLYPHHRTYIHTHPDAPRTKTRVSWR